MQLRGYCQRNKLYMKTCFISEKNWEIAKTHAEK